jgi:glycosyltransferase involved in cell wall biosynthesis
MRILVMTDDIVGPAMAGSALRAWELARALQRAEHTVRLVAARGSRPPSSDGPRPEARPPWRWAEAVVAPPWSLPPRAFLGRHLLIVDGVTPLLAELEAMPLTPEVARRRRTAAARLPLVAARADAIMVAGPAQVDWWSELIPHRFGLPFLHVPFGVPEGPPPDDREDIPGVPSNWAVVLWWGGVWPWLDLETLVAARARLGSAPLSVVVPTAPRPGSHTAGFSASDLRVLTRRYGLDAPRVVALDRWTPYSERHRILNRSSLLAVLHRAGDEAALSFRTRAMDGLWAAVPLMLSEGGEVARIARDRGWGAVVPPGDVAATAAALELVLGERVQSQCRAALQAGRSEWTWSRVTCPLVDALPTLPAARRRSVAGAAVAALRRLIPNDIGSRR